MWTNHSHQVSWVALQPKPPSTKRLDILNRQTTTTSSASKEKQTPKGIAKQPSMKPLHVWKTSSQPIRSGPPKVAPSVLTLSQSRGGFQIISKARGALHGRPSTWILYRARSSSTELYIVPIWRESISRMNRQVKAKAPAKIARRPWNVAWS